MRNTTFDFVEAYDFNGLMGSQIITVVLHIGSVDGFQVQSLQYVHLISLVIIWGMLSTIYFRFHEGCLRNLRLQYRNHTVIQNLNRQSEQLAHEKQVALNANEVIQRFYSSAAHDIRQPVYALKVYADIAQEDASQISKLLPKMTASCDAINALFASLFEVWNTGIGIDAAHLDHVFEELYKVGDFSSADEGFGLGLSVVKRLSGYAEGSTISVNSKIGSGSVFRFAMSL